MLYKCANESCSTPFRRLREGKLFQVETEYDPQGRMVGGGTERKARPWRRVEHYWLCDVCASFVTLAFDHSRGVITVPLPEGLGRKTVTMVSMKSEVTVGAMPPEEHLLKRLHEVQK